MATLTAKHLVAGNVIVDPRNSDRRICIAKIEHRPAPTMHVPTNPDHTWPVGSPSVAIFGLVTDAAGIDLSQGFFAPDAEALSINPDAIVTVIATQQDSIAKLTDSHEEQKYGISHPCEDEV
jgi:hypothetical protein